MSDPYAHNRIVNYTGWTLFLHPNQYYLGRCYLALDRKGPTSMIHLNEQEWKALQYGLCDVWRALVNYFRPDHVNHASLANEWLHCHIHIIPRYKSPRNFGGITFHDAQWSKNYAPYPEDFAIPESVHFAIRDALKQALR